MSDSVGRLIVDLDSMNETDVREIIVRPLLHRLGYRHGSEANIRTEVTLRYDKAFLGRKNPTKDPALVGRADYICEVISFGRWAIEVKAPNVPLDQDAVEQAHTYAAHPEIAAWFFLLTNGREFQLYQTGKLHSPALAWRYEDLENFALPLFNAVGPDAIRKLSNLMVVDVAKPLGRGLSSNVRLSGGVVTYEEHHSDHPLVDADLINGLQLPVTGGWVRRDDDGRLHGHIKLAKAAAIMGEMGEALGITDDYDFYSADEYISDDPNSPTIFQNLMEMHTPAGSRVKYPGVGEVQLPFGTRIKAFTEATGFVSDGVFRGTMRLDYDLNIEGLTSQWRMTLRQMLGEIPERAQFSGAGRFEVQFDR